MTLDEIREQLKERLSSAPFEFTNLTVRPSMLNDAAVTRFEAWIDHALPPVFRRMILAYDFGDFALGGVTFGHAGDYLSFLTLRNKAAEFPHFPWWGHGERPSNLILVAGTDGYVVLLDLEREYISAYCRDSTWTSMWVVASNFEVFVRAAGTLYLMPQGMQRAEALNQIGVWAGCDPTASFWRQM